MKVIDLNAENLQFTEILCYDLKTRVYAIIKEVYQNIFTLKKLSYIIETKYLLQTMSKNNNQEIKFFLNSFHPPNLFFY